jgi:hypothetical protein
LLSAQDQRIIDEAVRIVDLAQKKGVTIRILGALAVRLHGNNSPELFLKLARLGNTDRLFTDVDLVAYSKQKGKLRGLFEDELKFRAEIWSLLSMKDRIIYQHQDGSFKIDVFLDRLNYSHEVNFGSDPKKGRLGLDSPTITLADIMLEKLQIHQINDKDVKDVVILLHEHAISSGEGKETIDAKYIASVLARDWGFFHDASTNLGKVRELASEYAKRGLITADILSGIEEKIGQLLRYSEEQPKSKGWVSREKVGTQKQWWNDVEEVSR